MLRTAYVRYLPDIEPRAVGHHEREGVRRGPDIIKPFEPPLPAAGADDRCYPRRGRAERRNVQAPNVAGEQSRDRGALAAPGGSGTGNLAGLVSVVIPTRDRAALVTRAIRSVLSQTWQDLELIVVDDGSTDDTVAVVSGFSDRRIRLLRNERAGGQAAARNAGVRHARGDWVAFLDSDDEWVPTKLTHQMARLKADRSGATVVYCQARLDDALVRRRFTVRLVPHEGDVFLHLLEGWSPPTTSIFLVARTALVAAGGFDEALPCGEDYDLWLRLARGGHRFLVADAPLVIKHHGAWPRITSDPLARNRGFAILDRRWGPVIETRLGRRARSRWRSRGRARVDHAHSLQAQEAVRGGDRRAAWAHCRAMVRGLPASGRHLLRGVVCVLAGWRAAAALERARTRLAEMLPR